MDGKLFTDEQKHAFLKRMNLPVRVFIGLMLSLGTMILFGATTPSYSVWILEALVLLTMIVTVLLFSMEIIEEPPLIRLYAVMGFCWVGVLFGMTLIDYLTRGRFPV
jgi:cytochrome c oxidase subunit 4